MNIPCRDGEITLRYKDGKRKRYPTFSFQAGDNRVVLVIFPVLGLRNPPLSNLTEQLEQRASLSQVRALLANAPSPDHG